jgi:hypothetical protein
MELKNWDHSINNNETTCGNLGFRTASNAASADTANRGSFSSNIYSRYVDSNENSHLNAALEKHQKLIHLPPTPQQCSSLHQKNQHEPHPPSLGVKI